jgi:hypothetical protein
MFVSSLMRLPSPVSGAYSTHTHTHGHAQTGKQNPIYYAVFTPVGVPINSGVWEGGRGGRGGVGGVWGRWRAGDILEIHT